MNDSIENRAAPARPRKKKLGKRLARWMMLEVLPPVIHAWMEWFNRTALKDNERLLTLINHEWLVNRVRNQEGRVILAVWHNRLMFGPTAYGYCRGKKAVVMVSRSFDGDVISAVLGQFRNFEAVRGSSAGRHGADKGGHEALGEMIELGRSGTCDLVLTPDGPLGPVYKVKRGIIDLARATGLPIVSCAPNCSRYLKAKSWDQTRFPFPYAHFTYRVADPITVPADADEAAIEQKRQELERVMVEMTEYVDGLYLKKGKDRK